MLITQYIHIQLHLLILDETNMHQCKSIDLVIITLCARGRWSHTDQFFQIQIRYISNPFTNFSKMTTLLTSEVIMTDNNYPQIVTDIFQTYVEELIESKFVQKSIKMNFKHWTKEN